MKSAGLNIGRFNAAVIFLFFCLLVGFKQGSDRVVRRNICCYLLGRNAGCKLLRKQRYKIDMTFKEFREGKLSSHKLLREVDSLGYLLFLPDRRFRDGFVKSVCVGGDTFCIVNDTDEVTLVIDFLYHRLTKTVYYHYYVEDYRHLFEECLVFRLKGTDLWLRMSDVITKTRVHTSIHVLHFDNDWKRKLWKRIIDE